MPMIIPSSYFVFHHISERLALEQINAALRTGDSVAVLQSLQNPSAQLPEVYEDAAGLYSFEFTNIRSEKQVAT